MRSGPSGSRGIGKSVIEMISTLSPVSAETLFISLILLLSAFVLLPLAVSFYVRKNRRRRRKRSRGAKQRMEL